MALTTRVAQLRIPRCRREEQAAAKAWPRGGLEALLEAERDLEPPPALLVRVGERDWLGGVTAAQATPEAIPDRGPTTITPAQVQGDRPRS